MQVTRGGGLWFWLRGPSRFWEPEEMSCLSLGTFHLGSGDLSEPSCRQEPPVLPSCSFLPHYQPVPHKSSKKQDPPTLLAPGLKELNHDQRIDIYMC